MKQFDPIFFTEPSGDTKRPRTLYKGGGGGGDGGAAKRKAEEDARISSAIKRINQVFAVDKHAPRAIDQNAFYQDAQYDRRGNIINANGMEVQKIPVQQSRGYNPFGTWNNGMSRMGNSNMYGGLNFGRGVQRDKRLFNRSAYDRAVAEAAAEAQRLDQQALEQREGLYTKIGNDAKSKAILDLDKDRTIAQRDLGFMLARSGLSGGSRDVDVNREILDTYQQGVLRASNMGLERANEARSADDQTRVKLIQSIQAGLDEGSAMQQAYEGMRNNARQAQDAANMASLAGFFDTLVSQQKGAAYNDAYAQTVDRYRPASSAATPAIGGDGGRIRSY